MEAYRRVHMSLAAQIKHLSSRITKADDDLLKEAEILKDKLDDNHDDIIKTCAEDDVPAYIDQYLQVVDIYQDAYQAIRKAIPQPSPTPSNTSSSNVDVRLPRLELPTFSGDLTDWPTFSVRFKDTITIHDHLTESQKIQFLLNSLKGEARKIVSFFPPTAGSYDAMWDCLVEKYDRVQDTVYTVFYRLLDCAPATGPHDLECIAETASQVRRALALMQHGTANQDHIFNAILLRKMDPVTLSTWTVAQDQRVIPKTDDLIKFMILHSRASVKPAPPRAAQPNTGRKPAQDSNSSAAAPTQNPKPTTCPDCKLAHFLARCPAFMKASTPEKWTTVRKLKVCSNCLQLGHTVQACTGSLCRLCSRKHHTSLHYTDAERNAQKVAASVTSQSQILLATVIVQIADKFGKFHKFRGLLDSGSQATLISKDVLKTLKLKTIKNDTVFTSASGASETSTQSVDCTVSNVQGDFNFSTTGLVVPAVASPLPSSNINPEELKSLIQGKHLADPTFHKSSPVQILLGADVLAKVALGSLETMNNVIAQETKLGWVLLGSLPSPACTTKVIAHTTIKSPNIFWEIEEVPKRIFHSKEEREVEEFTNASTTKGNDGRFIMRLPLKADHLPLGSSRHIAISRLQSLERKFFKDEEYAVAYKATIKDYFDAGHLRPVTDNNVDSICYLPHHGVIKQSSTSTKLRVVFDASAKTSSGHSLNSILGNGPRLQEDLFSILTRFRTYPVAITADIEKMYRQIWLHPEDRDLQRIVWRENPADPLQDLQLTTVTFGEKSAPYMAIKALQFIADSCDDATVSKTLREDFYVDDLLSGAQTVQEAVALQSKVNMALSSSGFQTHKWASSHPEALQNVSANLRVKTTTITSKSEEDNKALGVLWRTEDDTMGVQVTKPKHAKWTRRKILSTANSLFDPLGLVAPVFITAKLIIQQVVKTTSNWDDPLPSSIIEEWQHWLMQLQQLQGIAVPRCIRPAGLYFTLCGFSDASEKAYAAVVYARCVTPTGVISRLVAAKTKVLPLKPITLPRIELLGALLLTRLLQAVAAATRTSLDTATAYTDSTITLAWIQGDPSRWHTFVANRVAEITTVLSPDQWQHVRSEDNPADAASRGISPSELLRSSLWWNGPTWLETSTNSGSTPQFHVLVPEQRKAVCALTTQTLDNFQCIFLRFSCYNKLRRVVALLHALAHKIRNPSSKIQRSAGDFTQADETIARWAQLEAFPKEIAALKKELPVPLASPLAPLNPRLVDGLLRVGGRLHHSHLSHSQKYPIILPSRHHITDLIIQDVHLRLLHGGASVTSTMLQQKYWVLHKASSVKRVINKCVQCAKCRAKLSKQLMADLPPARVNPPPRPFTNCGVDYAGPIQMKAQLVRATRSYPAYIALFVCLATRAIHLELVTALSTDAFLAAFQRFSSRRGLPSQMFSDRGTNFVGANNELELHYKLSEQGVQWHFNPPSAPHFGGLWEAGVKSVKNHLRRVIGVTRLNYEEFSTILCRTEAALNSRPLLPLSDDVDSLDVLTPAHFLIGGPIQSIPEEDWSTTPVSSLKRWHLIQKISQDIWQRWSNEYLSRLQQRPKWWRKAPNIQPGTLVLIHDANRPPLQWRMGRVLDVHTSDDSAVRVATLRTAYGEVQRPIQKLCTLPLDGVDS